MKKQKYSRVLFLCLLLCLTTATAAWAIVEPPPEVYVGDYADVLSAETEQLIIEENERLEALTGAQIVVATVDFLDGMEIEDYAYTVFNEWGIGDAEKNNGLLLLLVIGEENYWAMQGDGIYRALTSGMLDEYLFTYLEDDFAVGDYDAGVAKVFQAFVDWYDNYYQLNENTFPSNDVISGSNNYEENEDIDGGGFVTFIVFIVVLVIIISIIRRNKDRENRKNNSHNYPNNPNYPNSYPNMSGGSMNSGRTFRPYIYPRTSSKPRNTTRPQSKPASFGGGSSRGGGAGRSSAAGLGRSIGRSIGSSVGRSFGGGRSRGGGAGRR